MIGLALAYGAAVLVGLVATALIFGAITWITNLRKRGV